MANFKLKYLDNYPVVSFEENIEYPEAVFEGYFHDVIKTENMWGHILDSVKDNRTIQDIVYEKYTCDLLIGRNIDIYKLVSANHVTVTPEYGTSFTAIKFEVDTEDTNNRDKFAKITFYKELEINYPLSSDYAETVDASEGVNEIRYDVDNPDYVLNNLDVNLTNAEISRITGSSLLDNLNIGEYYYFHISNPDFADENKTLVYIYDYDSGADDWAFRFYPFGNLTTNYSDFELTLTHEVPGGESPDVLVTDKTISPIIYTFIEPKFRHHTETVEGKEAPDNVNENQKTKEHDICSFKIWLKESEKWKAEYLNYALQKDILISLDNYDNIIPRQVRNIIEIKENESFIDLFEYDITIKYNVKVVSMYR